MEEFVANVLSKECATEFVVNHNFFYGPCIGLVVSKVLGYAIILGSLIVKLPQILKILNAKSAKGIALLSVLLELVVMLFTLSYSFRKGFPFSTYGETVFMSVQNLVIVFLLYLYGGGVNAATFAIIGGYIGLTYAFLVNPGNIIPFELVVSLQALQIPLFVASRVPQIWSNFKSKSVGQLALITWLLNFAGSGARVFTTLKETNDPLMLAAYILGVVLNGIIVFQIIFYGDAETPVKKTTKKQQ